MIDLFGQRHKRWITTRARERLILVNLVIICFFSIGLAMFLLVH